MTPTPFSEAERNWLLRLPQIGPGLLTRLEAAGFHSLAQLRRVGAAEVMRLVCAQSGQRALANRQRALQRALRVAGAPDAGGTTAASASPARANAVPMRSAQAAGWWLSLCGPGQAAEAEIAVDPSQELA